MALCRIMSIRWMYNSSTGSPSENSMSRRAFAEDRYGKMPYRRCGNTGLKLPAVSLGFWQTLGRPGNEDLCRECCYQAFDNGITHFDLANNYGPPPGNSERVIGQILKDMPRDEMRGFYINALAGMAESVQAATGDEEMARAMLELCERFCK